MARGSIHDRKGPKGQAWEVRVYAGRDPLTGKERRITRTVRGTKKEAERVLTALQAEVDGGSHLGPDGDFAGLVERWWETCSPSWTQNTRNDFQGYLRRHILPALGDIPLRRLRPDDLDALYGRMTAGGLAPATVRRAHVIIHAALAQAGKWGWLPGNPADRASPPRVPRSKVNPPATAQLRALLDAADPELLCYLLLVADTGARRSEVSTLQWPHVDLDGSTVHLYATKTDKPRTIAISARTVAAVGRLRRHQVEHALALGLSLPADAFVFPHEDAAGVDFTRPWYPDSISRRVRILRDQLGLGPDVTIRNLRHYVATTMLTSGVDVRTVAGRLGHATPATTLNVYAHFQPAADRAAADVLAKVLEGDG